MAQIEPDPGQPRREFEPLALHRLAESIRREGVHQPLHVYRLSGDCYRIKDGERRWRAARLAEVEQVPCVVQQAGTWLQTRLHQFLTNDLQEPLTPLEDAQALYLLWLGYQVEALEREQGTDGTATAAALLDAHLPTAQIAVLEAQLCALAGVETVSDYLGTGRVRVPWQRVLDACGRGDWSADRRKKHLAVLRVAPEVQDALAGADVSARTLRELASCSEEVQQTLIADVRHDEPDNLGTALRAALQRMQEREVVARYQRREEALEEAPLAPVTTRPIGASELAAGRRHGWPPEMVDRLASQLTAALTVLDSAPATPVDEAGQNRLLPLVIELQERLAGVGVELPGWGGWDAG